MYTGVNPVLSCRRLECFFLKESEQGFRVAEFCSDAQRRLPEIGFHLHVRPRFDQGVDRIGLVVGSSVVQGGEALQIITRVYVCPMPNKGLNERDAASCTSPVERQSLNLLVLNSAPAASRVATTAGGCSP